MYTKPFTDRDMCFELYVFVQVTRALWHMFLPGCQIGHTLGSLHTLLFSN